MAVAELGTEANREKQRRGKKEYEGERKTLQEKNRIGWRYNGEQSWKKPSFTVDCRANRRRRRMEV
jgi:hypothetical protein